MAFQSSREDRVINMNRCLIKIIKFVFSVVLIFSMVYSANMVVFASEELFAAIDADISGRGNNVEIKLSLSCRSGIGAISGDISYDKEHFELSSAKTDNNKAFLDYNDTGGIIHFICMNRNADEEEILYFQFRTTGKIEGKQIFSYSTLQALDSDGNEIKGCNKSFTLDLPDSSSIGNTSSASRTESASETESVSKPVSSAEGSSKAASEKAKESTAASGKSSKVSEIEKESDIPASEEASLSTEEVSAGLAKKDRTAGSEFPVGITFGIAVGLAAAAGAALFVSVHRKRKK